MGRQTKCLERDETDLSAKTKDGNEATDTAQLFVYFIRMVQSLMLIFEIITSINNASYKSLTTSTYHSSAFPESDFDRLQVRGKKKKTGT